MCVILPLIHPTHTVHAQPHILFTVRSSSCWCWFTSGHGLCRTQRSSRLHIPYALGLSVVISNSNLTQTHLLGKMASYFTENVHKPHDTGSACLQITPIRILRVCGGVSPTDLLIHKCHAPLSCGLQKTWMRSKWRSHGLLVGVFPGRPGNFKHISGTWESLLDALFCMKID